MLRARKHEEHRFGHILGSDAGALLDHLGDARRLGEAPQLVGDHTRRNRADTDTMRRHLPAQRVDKALDSVLRRAVDRLPDKVDKAGDRAGHQDVARFLRHHVRQHGVNRAQNTVDVDIHQVRPRVRIAFGGLSGDVDASVGKEHIDAPKPRHRLLDHRHDLRADGDVGGNNQHVCAAKFIGQRLKPVGRACSQRQLAAAVRQCPRRCCPNPRAGAGDNHDLVGKVLCHEFPPSLEREKERFGDWRLSVPTLLVSPSPNFQSPNLQPFAPIPYRRAARPYLRLRCDSRLPAHDRRQRALAPKSP